MATNKSLFLNILSSVEVANTKDTIVSFLWAGMRCGSPNATHSTQGLKLAHWKEKKKKSEKPFYRWLVSRLKWLPSTVPSRDYVKPRGEGRVP
jgi:hypothetical protein